MASAPSPTGAADGLPVAGLGDAAGRPQAGEPPARRPPGIGRMTVRSLSSGSRRGCRSLAPASPGSPTIRGEDWETRRIRGSRTRPRSASAANAGCCGRAQNRTRRHRTGSAAARPATGRTAMPGSATLTRSRICSTAPILTCAGNSRRSCLGRHIGLHDQHKARRTQDRAIDDRADPHAVAPLLQRDRDRGLLEHRRQRSAQIGDDRRKAALQIVVAVGGVVVGPPRRLGEGGELAGHLHKARNRALPGGDRRHPPNARAASASG